MKKINIWLLLFICFPLCLSAKNFIPKTYKDLIKLSESNPNITYQENTSDEDQIYIKCIDKDAKYFNIAYDIKNSTLYFLQSIEAAEGVSSKRILNYLNELNSTYILATAPYIEEYNLIILLHKIYVPSTGVSLEYAIEELNRTLILFNIFCDDLMEEGII